MPQPRLSKLELQIMDVLWTHGASSIREIHDRLPGPRTSAYTTVQTMVNRLEAKKALKRGKTKISNAHVYEAAISRKAAEHKLIDEFLDMIGGGMQPLMTHLVESGKLTLDDVQQAERLLRELAKKRRQT